MKFHRFIVSVVLMSFATMAFAQSDAHKSDSPNSGVKKSEAPKSEAQKSFEKLKALAGNWEGPVTLDPPHPEMSNGLPLHVSLRETSRGNALVHEMQEAGTPLDAKRYDHPVTMLYLDGDQLLLTHYCDAGNRPRMKARTSPDGKTVEFDFVDITGNTKYGHMDHAVFTAIDENHHTEDWTFLLAGDKPMHAHFDLKRISTVAAK